jgi:hypothetical protein
MKARRKESATYCGAKPSLLTEARHRVSVSNVASKLTDDGVADRLSFFGSMPAPVAIGRPSASPIQGAAVGMFSSHFTALFIT